MMVVGGIVELRRGMLMTRRADLVALMLQTRGMGVVTVGAADSLVVHLALQKRPVNINLVVNLAVGMVGGGLEDGGQCPRRSGADGR